MIIEQKLKTKEVDENKFKVEEPNARKEKFEKIDEEKVQKTIGELNTKSCRKLDPIPTNILKECKKELASPIKHIVNNTIEKAKYPRQLKESAMTPIIKKKGLDTEELAHFRPLCQGAVMNKIIDKQIHNQMSEYLQDNEMESPNQAG